VALKPKKGGRIIYVDEVTKPVLRKFFDYLVDGDEDNDGPANRTDQKAWCKLGNRTASALRLLAVGGGAKNNLSLADRSRDKRR